MVEERPTPRVPAVPNARTVILSGAGHMMMSERPDELLAALKS